MSQVRTHGPFVIFLNQVDDYECCSPGIVLLFEIVFYVKDEEAVEMRVKPPVQRKGTSSQAGRGEVRLDYRGFIISDQVGPLSSRLLLDCDC